MDKIEICKKIKKSIRKLVLFDKEQVKCWGTGVVINDGGIILTANHVISDYSRLIYPKIIAYGIEDVPAMEYKPRLFNVSFDIKMPDFAKPLTIDLAIIEPIKNIDRIPYIQLEDEITIEGTEIIMAGFPDEVSPPLNFNEMLNFNNPELNKNKFQIEKFFKVYMRLIMIKGGMIGSAQKINISGSCEIPELTKSIEAKGAVYWIDNASNHGASGGPVVNFSGRLIGIISEKGLTKQEVVPNLSFKVPSGSTMALSHNLITWALK